MLHQDADYIIDKTLRAVQPDEAVRKALQDKDFEKGKVFLIAIGKAAWKMAAQACQDLGSRLEEGVVITKYDHVGGPLERTQCFEAGHPIPDENSFLATRKAIECVKKAQEDDTILFLVSGGGSALFELPLIRGEELQKITQQMLASGADIKEMNTIRKRLSAVKGGKFAEICKPAKVYSIVLSDIIGDPLDMIASGPAYPDSSTCEDALELTEKYGWSFSEDVMKLLAVETPKKLDNVETIITGSVSNLCQEASQACQELGYKSHILTDVLDCEAREAGYFLGAIGKTQSRKGKKVAFIAGGETIVHLHGKGKGGRNQEIALAAAEKIDNLDHVAIFSIGSDGTDGPTDAAGGFVDGSTKRRLEEKGVSIFDTLLNNDSYHALDQVGGLIKTGPTGTNVNDVAVVLIEKE